jgi:hypothetical protein
MNPSEQPARIATKRTTRSHAKTADRSPAYAEMTAASSREAEAEAWVAALLGDGPLLD